MEDIYGGKRDVMTAVMNRIIRYIEANGKRHEQETGNKLYEHLSCRIKSEESMREKLARKGLEVTAENALHAVHDAIGVRVVCLFIDDVYETVRLLKDMSGCTVVQEKDYIRDAKPNGYRSYHMILETLENGEKYSAEIQLRTIAMDTWAALEHELKYKKSLENTELIVQELRRCANELAACDVSMQTIRRIIKEA